RSLAEVRIAHHLWLTAVVVATTLVSPAVANADTVPRGGRAPIVIDGQTACTLTAIGNDSQGNLVGFTSAHCGGPGAQVASETAVGAGALGVMVAGNDALDYAVIKFDPAKVTPVNNYNGFQINGIGRDPTVGQIACKKGRWTGKSCGVVGGVGEQAGAFLGEVGGGPGDSGVPGSVDGRLVGMIDG